MPDALDPPSLRRRCDPAQFEFATTADLPDLAEPMGQRRALSALDFATDIAREGYNLYAIGEPGTGKHSLVREALLRRAAGESTPCDWCYLNNFAEPHKPLAIALANGRAQALRGDMLSLVQALRAIVPETFASEVYRSRVAEIEQGYERRQEDAFAEIHEQARRENMSILHTPGGFGIAPVRNNEVLGPEEYEALGREERQRIDEITARLRERLSQVLLQAPEHTKRKREEIEALNREVATAAIEGPVEELRGRYADVPAVSDYLDAVRNDVLANLVEFGERPSHQSNPLGLPTPPAPFFRRYQVNVMVEHAADSGAPVVYLDNPNYRHLMGRIEFTAQMGTLVTDFTQVMPGAIHRANGGYLVLEARKVLQEPYSWYALKRALNAREVVIESVGELLGLASTVSLEPAPIPLDAKVVLLGEPLIYQLLCAYDPEFADLFKVTAEFADDVERDAGNTQVYAQLVAGLARKHELLAFEREAVAEVVDQSARLAGDAGKLSLHMRSVSDLLSEADHWAREDGAGTVARAHVVTAVAKKRERVSHLPEKLREAVLRETLLIDTAGATVGQVNGLSVLQSGAERFGHPARITATVRLGKGEVIDVQREVELGGAIHSKGVLILSAYLGSRYAADSPLSLAASLVFEQTYAVVDGDSASVAELCALLSALGDAPLRQSLAITGSVNQLGQVQAIGGVNEKIEAFYDLCAARGLSGEQGVLIPRSNVKNLMLREDVVEAAAQGRFHVYPVDSVDAAVELLTGLPAGTREADGTFTPGSLNARVAERLARYTQTVRAFTRADESPP